MSRILLFFRKGEKRMLDKYKIATTKEKIIRRIVESLFLMILGIYIIGLYDSVIGIISIAISSIVILLHLYLLVIQKNSLSSVEIKITTEKDERLKL